MNNTFINPVLTKSAELGIGLYEDNDPIELFADSSPAEIELAIRAIYRQVLGNVHIMESDRLINAESQLKNGDLTVRDFVRTLAKSTLYRSLFFDNYSSLRAIELNFKHLLGRAPHDYEEVVRHNQILHSEGYDADIDSYLDSEEYEQNFGNNIVPCYRGYKTQTGKNVRGFTHIFSLLRGSCSSDRSTFKGTKPRLQTALIGNQASSIVPLSKLTSTWETSVAAYKPKTDIERLLSTTLNLKTYKSTMSNSESNLQTEFIDPRSVIWQNQYNALANNNPIELISGSSETEIEIVIRAAYKQVFGNAHLMSNERLTIAESKLKQGEISVREFVRTLAKSELYKSRFIDNCPRYRSHELNFKHLLGRAPGDYQETLHHSQILDSQGYDADIDSYIDSEEYQSTFGENIVPYYRGYKTQTGQTLLGYTNMFKMLESVSTSDKAGISSNAPRLVKSIIYNNPNGYVPVTDVNQLLQDVLKPKTQPSPTPKSTYVYPSQQPSLTEQQGLDGEIAALEAQIADLKPYAAIANSGMNKWQSYYVDLDRATSSSSKTNRTLNPRNALQEKQDKIAQLKNELAQAKSMATVGEARLNKWRSKVFF